MTGRISAIVFFAAAGALWAQDSRPAYEAANIKVNTSGSTNSSSNGSRTQLIVTNVSLRRLVERAYNVKPYEVAGPAWIDDVRFDIAAKYPENLKVDERPLFLRTLLEDRLKLTTHREKKDLPGYALQVAKGGIKLKTQPNDGHTSINNHGDGRVDTLQATHVTMAGFAEWLSRRLNETVVDGTGLEDAYDLDMKWTIDDQAVTRTDGDVEAARFTALQDALATVGLRLHQEKVPVEIVVVDHAERVPVDN